MLEIDVEKLLKKDFFRLWDQVCESPRFRLGCIISVRCYEGPPTAEICLCPILAVLYMTTGKHRSNCYVYETGHKLGLTENETQAVVRAADWDEGGELLKTSDYMSIRNRLMKPVLELRG